MGKLPVKSIVIGLPALIGLVLILWWLQQGFVMREEYVLEPGSDSVSVYNRFYAAERLLARSGIATQSIRNLTDVSMLHRRDTLLLNTPSHFIGERLAGELLDWVADGGHLIVSVARSFDARQNTDDQNTGDQEADNDSGFWAAGDDDTLLQALKLDVRETGYRRTLIELNGLTQQDRPLQTPGPQRAQIPQWAQVPLRAYFYSAFELYDPFQQAFFQAAAGDRTQLLRYSRGEGVISVFTDLGMFDNQRIAEYEHADVLWALLHAEGTPAKVWLQYAPQIPSLFALLWRHAWMFLLALLITLAALIWAGNLRLGPQLIEHPSGQRRLSEHLHASGRFLWRRGASQVLLDAVREHTRHGLRRRYPHWQTLSDAERIEYIVNLTGLTREQVETALFRNTAVTAGDFQQIIRILKRIGNKV